MTGKTVLQLDGGRISLVSTELLRAIFRSGMSNEVSLFINVTSNSITIKTQINERINILGDEGLYQNILKQVELNMVDSKDCEKQLQTTRLGSDFKLKESFICAGGTEGVDTCTGDGGGPLVCPRKNDTGTYVQVPTIND